METYNFSWFLDRASPTRSCGCRTVGTSRPDLLGGCDFLVVGVRDFRSFGFRFFLVVSKVSVCPAGFRFSTEDLHGNEGGGADGEVLYAGCRSML